MAQIDFLGDPIFQAVDGNGVPVAGGLVWCYDAGTDNPRTMYSTIQDAINQTNPVGSKVTLDSSGRYPIVYAGASKFVLEDNDVDPDTGHGTVIWTADNVGRFGNTVIDPNGNIIVDYDYQPDAKNYFQIENAPSGQSPIISSQGIDAEIGAIIKVKGTTKGVTIQSDGDAYTFPAIDGPSGTFLSTDGDGNVSWVVPPGISQVIPPGVMIDFAGQDANIPAGWLFCAGQAVSRSTYANLFAAIGTTWGAGDGVNTFNLPNAQRRTAVGSGGTGNIWLGNAVGAVGGEESHAQTEAELAFHSHVYGRPEFTTISYASGALVAAIAYTSSSQNTSATGFSVPFNIIQPSYVVNKIIKI